MRPLTLLPLTLLLACSESKLQTIEDPVEEGSDDTAEETVPEDTEDTAPPKDTAPPRDTAPEDTADIPLRQSCLDILNHGESIGDGSYTIEPPCGGERTVYCDMTTDGGGWTRIVAEDYSVDDCPGDWQAEPKQPLCSRQAVDDSGLIRAAQFDAWCIPHTAVRGQVIGYQYYTTDAFGDTPPVDIDDTYSDVISVTLAGKSGTEHLFSYGIGFKNGGSDDSNCPDVFGGARPPAFVGEAWACEVGNLSEDRPEERWYTEQPLFDELWFQADREETTDVGIDVRLIGTGLTTDEDIGIGRIELQIR